MDKLIVNAAVTGMVPAKADNPAVPITPEEIAEDSRRCRDAGASIVHLHARDETGQAAWQPEIYREILSRVRRAAPDIILCVSTSGRVFRSFEQRSAVLDVDDGVKPEMASLTLGSMNFPKRASVNEPEMIAALAERMREREIVPELEVFDWGMIDYAKYLIGRRVLREPFYFNLLLGSLGTVAATPLHLATLVSSLPVGSTWAGAGIGRFQLLMNSLAVTMGGHVRVGLEDNLYYDQAKQRPASNPGLIDRVVAVAKAIERPVATPAEARAMIGLPAITGAATATPQARPRA